MAGQRFSWTMIAILSGLVTFIAGVSTVVRYVSKLEARIESLESQSHAATSDRIYGSVADTIHNDLQRQINQNRRNIEKLPPKWLRDDIKRLDKRIDRIEQN